MEIRDEHIEWAVVNRLKDMLENPPQTEFSVTRSFAFFAAVVIWRRNRAWVGGKYPGNKPLTEVTDKAAHLTRLELHKKPICDPLWSLSRTSPIIRASPEFAPSAVAGDEINSDFKDATAESFFLSGSETHSLRRCVQHSAGAPAAE